MSRLTYGSLFAGVGGFDQGFDRAGMECRWQCEWETKCQELLKASGQTPNTMEILQKSAPENSSELMLFAEEAHVRTYPWQDFARAWLEAGADSSTKWLEFVSESDRASSSGKTSMEPLALTAAEISRLSCVLSRVSRLKFLKTDGDGPASSRLRSLRGGGIALGGCSMRSISEWPKDAAVCSLSQVLETDVARKYYLSPKACAGILRRAANRGKELPPQLAAALQAVADSAPTSTSMGD